MWSLDGIVNESHSQMNYREHLHLGKLREVIMQRCQWRKTLKLQADEQVP